MLLRLGCADRSIPRSKGLLVHWLVQRLVIGASSDTSPSCPLIVASGTRASKLLFLTFQLSKNKIGHRKSLRPETASCNPRSHVGSHSAGSAGDCHKDAGRSGCGCVQRHADAGASSSVPVRSLPARRHHDCQPHYVLDVLLGRPVGPAG